MRLDALVFNQENFDLLREEYRKLILQYNERGAAMQDTGDVVRSLYIPERKLMLKAEARYGRKFPAVDVLLRFLMDRENNTELTLSKAVEQRNFFMKDDEIGRNECDAELERIAERPLTI